MKTREEPVMVYNDFWKREIPDLPERLDEALRRLRMRTDGMRIPADPSDTDLVLLDAKTEIVSLRALLAALRAERDEAVALLGEAAWYVVALDRDSDEMDRKTRDLASRIDAVLARRKA